MAEHKRISGKGQEDLKGSRYQKKYDPPHYGQLKNQDERVTPATDFLVQPSVDEYAALLANIHSDEQRANVVTRLQQAYGNFYVQRIIECIAATRVGEKVSEGQPASIKILPGAPVLQRQEPATAEQTGLSTISTEVPALTQGTVNSVKSAIEEGKQQEAIDLIIAELKDSRMPNLESCDGKTMKYNPAVSGEGLCSFEYDAPTNKATRIWVEIGDEAFYSAAWLYSAMMHEYQHVNQVLADPKATKGNQPMAEFAAYCWEIFHAFETGLRNDPAGLEDIGTRLLEQGWSQMTENEQRANQITYDAAIGFIRGIIGDETWTP